MMVHYTSRLADVKSLCTPPHAPRGGGAAAAATHSLKLEDVGRVVAHPLEDAAQVALRLRVLLGALCAADGLVHRRRAFTSGRRAAKESESESMHAGAAQGAKRTTSRNREYCGVMVSAAWSPADVDHRVL